MMKKNWLLWLMLIIVLLMFTSGGCGGSTSDSSNDEQEPYATRDTDKDKLLDWEEDYFGTDINRPDTDGDEINDYIEVKILHSDPLASDDPGASKDTDNDGLSDLAEVKMGTNPTQKDTDGDSLGDGEEVNEYNTNPLLYDTDGDNLGDGEEIELGLNPLNSSDSNTLIEQTLDPSNIADELLATDQMLIPSVKGYVAGSINRHLQIVPQKIDSFNENHAKVGSIIDIQMDESIAESEGYLDLTFDGTNLFSAVEEDASAMAGLVICGYANGELTPYDTKVNGTTISARVPIGGAYFVLDADMLLRGLGINIMAEVSSTMTRSSKQSSASNELSAQWYADHYENVNGKHILRSARVNAGTIGSILPRVTASGTRMSAMSVSGQADIMFVVDSTGSMGDDIDNVARNINDFVTRLKTEYDVAANFALVEFKDIEVNGLDSTKIVKNGAYNWYYNVDAYREAINGIYVSGGGDSPESDIDALEMARLIEDWRTPASKFIILVTDENYKINSRYDGIDSMSIMAKRLAASGIITSVVSAAYYEELYRELYTTTGGLFADINGNFSDVLMVLADKIGAETSGTWVLLNDFQYVRLSAPLSPTNGNDTDGDGVSDYLELGKLKTLSLTVYVKKALEKAGIPEHLYTGKTEIEVYDYVSSPVYADTDYDGIDDNLDSRPNYQYFSGRLYDTGQEIDTKVEFVFDYRSFFEDNTIYKPALSRLSLILAATAYHTTHYYENVGEEIYAKDLLRRHGMRDTESYELTKGEYSDDHLSEAVIGHRTVAYGGEIHEIIAIVVRGTNAPIEEWSSDFDIGNTEESHPEWINKDHHMGFDVATNRLMTHIRQYVNNLALPTEHKRIFWITGHSRGAAIGNIIAANLIDEGDVFAYLFAVPSTTTSTNAQDDRYACIFNVINQDDLVPRLPPAGWNGFKRYGKTAVSSIQDNYKNEWDKLSRPMGLNPLLSYDANALWHLELTVKSMEDLAENRNDAYSYGKSFSTVDMNLAEAALIPGIAEPFCRKTSAQVWTPILVAGYHVEQTSMYFMKLLANAMADSWFKVNTFAFVFDYNLAPRYQYAKSCIISSNVGGIKHPHTVTSYYVLAKNLSRWSFF
jgi:hypothetical protein